MARGSVECKQYTPTKLRAQTEKIQLFVDSVMATSSEFYCLVYIDFQLVPATERVQIIRIFSV